MRKIIYKSMLLIVGLCISILLIVSVPDVVTGIKNLLFVRKMGAGINIGNTLDVIGVREWKPDAGIADYETAWHNPLINQELFRGIKEAGFNSVRIPVSWGEHMDDNGQIDAEWMARVKQVVDLAMEENLYVVLNTHHELWIIPDEAHEAQVTEQLCTLWSQIADTFSEYDERLLFEVMNEPRMRNTSIEWNGGNAEVQEVVNRINAAFVKTIRESGGENAKRYLILPGYGHNHDFSALENIRLPEDDRLIVAVHAYIPYSFTLEEDGTEEWSKESEEDTEQISELMSFLRKQFVRKGIPVIVTEYGCREKDNPKVREEWAEYYVSQAKKNYIGLFWWDQGGDMKLFDRVTGECTQPEMVEILTGVSQ